jgi:hypothetical protein
MVISTGLKVHKVLRRTENEGPEAVQERGEGGLDVNWASKGGHEWVTRGEEGEMIRYQS